MSTSVSTTSAVVTTTITSTEEPEVVESSSSIEVMVNLGLPESGNHISHREAEFIRRFNVIRSPLVQGDKVFVSRFRDIMFQLETDKTRAFCIICHCIGAKAGAIRSFVQGNGPKHLRCHSRRGHFTGLDLEKLGEAFKGIRIHLNFLKPKKLVPGSELAEATTDFIIASGSSIRILDLEEFRDLLETARSLPEGSNLVVGSAKVETNVEQRFIAEMNNMRAAISRSDSFSIIHDCWEWSRLKYIGATIRVAHVDENGDCELEIFPFCLRRLTGNEENPETISSAENCKDLIELSLKRLNVQVDKLVTAMSDGAPAAKKASVLIASLGGLKLFSNTILDKKEHTCVCHSLSLVGRYSLGITESTSEASSIPKGPSDEISQLLKKVRRIVKAMSDSKSWVQLENQSKNVTAVSLDVETRWGSTYTMLKGFLDNYEIHKNWAIQNEKERCSESNYLEIVAIEAVLRPLMLAIKVLQSNKPLAQFILPLILTLLFVYGIDVSKGLFGDMPFMNNEKMKDSLKYDVRGKGWTCLKQLPNQAMELVVVLRSHIYYRLVEQRANLNGLELLATFSDPMTKRYFVPICRNRSEEFEKILNEVICKLSGKQINPVTTAAPKATEETELFEAALLEPLPSEIIRFGEEATRVGAGVSTSFSGLIKTISSWNTLKFWDESRRQLFPGIFKANLVCWSIPTSSSVQESIFSSVKDTLTQRRRRLAESPDLLEELCLLRYKWGMKRTREEFEEDEFI